MRLCGADPFAAGGKLLRAGEQGKVKLGHQPSEESYTNEEEKQAGKKEHVVDCAHSHSAGARQQGGEQPAYGSLIIHKNATELTRLALLRCVNRPSSWPEFGSFHGTIIGSKALPALWGVYPIGDFCEAKWFLRRSPGMIAYFVDIAVCVAEIRRHGQKAAR
jgi:hypothetical protein